MTFYGFFKVRSRCVGFTVDHSLQVYSESIAARIQVRGCRRSRYRNLQAGDFVVIEMAVVNLFYTTDNVTCTVASQRYALLLQEFIILALQARRCDPITMFMQDDVPPHIAHFWKQLLRRYFCEDRIISRR